MTIAAIVGSDKAYHADVHCPSLKRNRPLRVWAEYQVAHKRPCFCWRIDGYVVKPE